MENIRLNYLESQVDKVRNDTTATLDDNIIAKCYAFRNFKTEYVKQFFGGNLCTYEEVKKRMELRDKCVEEASEEKNRTMNYINLFLSDSPLSVKK